MNTGRLSGALLRFGPLVWHWDRWWSRAIQVWRRSQWIPGSTKSNSSPLISKDNSPPRTKSLQLAAARWEQVGDLLARIKWDAGGFCIWKSRQKLRLVGLVGHYHEKSCFSCVYLPPFLLSVLTWSSSISSCEQAQLQRPKAPSLAFWWSILNRDPGFDQSLTGSREVECKVKFWNHLKVKQHLMSCATVTGMQLHQLHHDYTMFVHCALLPAHDSYIQVTEHFAEQARTFDPWVWFWKFSNQTCTNRYSTIWHHDAPVFWIVLDGFASVCVQYVH